MKQFNLSCYWMQNTSSIVEETRYGNLRIGYFWAYLLYTKERKKERKKVESHAGWICLSLVKNDQNQIPYFAAQLFRSTTPFSRSEITLETYTRVNYTLKCTRSSFRMYHRMLLSRLCNVDMGTLMYHKAWGCPVCVSPLVKEHILLPLHRPNSMEFTAWLTSTLWIFSCI